MRKILVLILTGVFLATAFVQVIAQDNSTEDYDIFLEYEFSKPTIKNIQKNGKIFERIEIDGLSNTNEPNKLSVPVKGLKILIPMSKEIDSIDVFSKSIELIGNIHNPEKGSNLFHLSSVNKKIDEEIDKKSRTDQSNIYYENIGEYEYRGFKILHLNLYPVKIDLDSNKIFYYRSIKVGINTKNIVSSNFNVNYEDKKLVKNIVENPIDVNSYNDLIKKSIDSYEYLIITSENFKNYNGEYSFNDLIESKISKGISAKIVTVEEITSNPDYSVDGTWGDNNPTNPFYESEIVDNIELFDDTPARIRNFIRHYYSDFGTRFVLLGGDADVENTEDNIIPLRGLFANESGLPLNNNPPEEEQDDIPSDVYYACLDGNFNYDCDDHFGESSDRNDIAEIDEADLYSEVWVGRACVDSVGEITNFVRKTLTYDQIGDSYLEEILFVGEHLGFPGISNWGGNYKDIMEGYVPDYYNLEKIYDRDHPDNSWYPLDLIEHLNTDTPQIINHDGHGNHDYILKMSSSYLTSEYLNNEKPFFIYSHSCLTGSFDNYNCWSGYMENDCVAEVLTCENRYGAFACILNARYGLGSEDSLESPSGFLDESFYKALFTENIRGLGAASHFSKEDNVYRIDENGVRWCYYQTNLFGDPELSIKSPNKRPSPPEISGPSSGEFGTEYSYDVSSIDPDGDKVYYWVEWFEGCPGVNWAGPYDSGEVVTFDNTWNSRGRYAIKITAKDEKGAFSEPSTFEVTMPKIKLFKGRFFQNYPFFYNLLDKIFIL